jgi:RNA-binding protein YlmH
MQLDVTSLLGMKFSSWYSRFERFSESLMAAAEEAAAAEAEFIEEDEVTEKVSLFDAEEVNVVRIDLYERGRERRLVADAVLSPTRDMESQATIRVFEMRILNTRVPVGYEHVDLIVTRYLKGYDLQKDLIDEIVDQVCERLEDEGFPITYD